MINKSDISRLIANMVDKDQNLRKKLFKKGYNPTKEERLELRKLDRKNTSHMKEIVKNHGFISISKYGKETSFNAWLLIQHGTHDIDFMEYYLKLMKANLDDVNPKNYAYLKDRVLLMQGKRQIYATQVTQDEKTKEYKPSKLNYSIKKTNRLRREIGLEPIEEYLKNFN